MTFRQHYKRFLDRISFHVHLKVKVNVTQLCSTLWDPMDYTVHGIFQARILEWVAFPFSRGSSQPRDQTLVSRIADGFFYQLSHKGHPRTLNQVAYPFSRGSSWPRNGTQVSSTAGGFFTNWTIREAHKSLNKSINMYLVLLPEKIGTELSWKPMCI